MHVWRRRLHLCVSTGKFIQNLAVFQRLRHQALFFVIFRSLLPLPLLLHLHLARFLRGLTCLFPLPLFPFLLFLPLAFSLPLLFPLSYRTVPVAFPRSLAFDAFTILKAHGRRIGLSLWRCQTLICALSRVS